MKIFENPIEHGDLLNVILVFKGVFFWLVFQPLCAETTWHLRAATRLGMPWPLAAQTLAVQVGPCLDILHTKGSLFKQKTCNIFPKCLKHSSYCNGFFFFANWVLFF